MPVYRSSLVYAGGSCSVWVDGGTKWFQARPGQPFEFPVADSGMGLHWKARLNSLSPALSPLLDTLVIDKDFEGDGIPGPDDDNDGMTDTYEDAHPVLNSKDPSDAGNDPDGDGLTSLEEFQKDPGLDPNDPDSDSDGIGDALDDLPIVGSNQCTMNTGQFTLVTTPVSQTVTCAADSILVQSVTVDSPGRHLILMSLGQIAFDPPFSSGLLSVINTDPCPNCVFTP